MASEGAASRRAPPFIDPPGCAQHRPEATLLYRLVDQHYPALLAGREAADRPLPRYVQQEFEAYLKCGRLEHGFLRVCCDDCHAEKLVPNDFESSFAQSTPEARDRSDAEQSYLAIEPEAGGAMDDLLGHSITYRVAVGPRAGQKVF